MNYNILSNIVLFHYSFLFEIQESQTRNAPIHIFELPYQLKNYRSLPYNEI